MTTWYVSFSSLDESILGLLLDDFVPDGVQFDMMEDMVSNNFVICMKSHTPQFLEFDDNWPVTWSSATLCYRRSEPDNVLVLLANTREGGPGMDCNLNDVNFVQPSDLFWPLWTALNGHWALFWKGLGLSHNGLITFFARLGSSRGNYSQDSSSCSWVFSEEN